MQFAFSRVPQRVRLNTMAGKPGKKERGRTRDGENASWLKRNSMSIAMFSLFLVSIIGQFVAGHRTYNDDQSVHGQPTVAVTE